MRYEIRAMDFGEILDTGFRLLRDHVLLLVGIGLTVSLPANLGMAAMGAQPDMASIAAGAGVLLFAVVVAPIASAATIFALGELYLGRTATIGGSLREALRIALPLLGTGFLATLAMLFGLILLVIPFIYLAFAFMLIYQVVVVERAYGAAAMRRSRDLMRGNFLRGFGLMLVVLILYAVVSVAAGFATLAGPVVGAVAQALTQAIYSGFQAAVLLVFYFDIRCRKEAFDVEHLATLVEARVA